MNLTFYGAAKNVTGSCFLLSISGKNILIDCGMKQGCEDCDNKELGFNANQIDFVLLTHAHLDHSGRLPLLVKNGFGGPIIATGATCSLLEIMLRDSAKIQEMDAKWENQKGARAGHENIEPLYTIQDVEFTLKQLVPHEYEEKIKLFEGVSFKFTDGGHLLGSASITFYAKENGKEEIIVFSGDIGNTNQPIINDPKYLEQADYVIMEATYGDREHDIEQDYTVELAKIFESTFVKGGNVVIPSFSVGRTQQLLYFIREIKERKLVLSIPDFNVYVDSPLSIAATKIYADGLLKYGDPDTEAVLARGINPLSFENLHFTQTSDESKAINFDMKPKVIISSSGMCEAGRIRHHLKHNLWRSSNAIVFVGFQANGTLGRYILNGAKKIKLFGEEIAVKANIYNFTGLSAHAGRTGLLTWLTAIKNKPRKVFIVHSEEESAESFKELLTLNEYDAYIPNPLAVVDLTENVTIALGTVPQKKHEFEHKRAFSTAYAKLQAACKHLFIVVEKHEHAANKEIEKLTNQIDNLADRFDFKE